MGKLDRDHVPVFVMHDEDHDQVRERLVAQALIDGLDPAWALTLDVAEYIEERDRIAFKRAS